MKLSDFQIISPTGKGLRQDGVGSGKFGARRGNRLHEAYDFLCEPGQDVISPINGMVIRTVKPYTNGHYSGLQIFGAPYIVNILYIEPDIGLIGHLVSKGDVIGQAQDIRIKYQDKKMMPHIHMSIMIDPFILLEIPRGR